MLINALMRRKTESTGYQGKKRFRPSTANVYSSTTLLLESCGTLSRHDSQEISPSPRTRHGPSHCGQHQEPWPSEPYRHPNANDRPWRSSRWCRSQVTRLRTKSAPPHCLRYPEVARDRRLQVPRGHPTPARESASKGYSILTGLHTQESHSPYRGCSTCRAPPQKGYVPS